MKNIEEQYLQIVKNICQQHKISYVKILRSKKYLDIINFISDKYQHIKNIDFREMIYLFVNNLYERPKCKTCGNDAKFYTYTNGYRQHCSLNCLNTDPDHIKTVMDVKICKYGHAVCGGEQLRKINMEKYGVEIVNQFNGPKKFLEKSKKTTLDHYGVDHNLKSEKVRNAIKQTKLKCYGNENYNNIDKTKQTKLERYGDESYNNHEKFKHTMNIKYGVDYAQQSNIIKQKSGYRYKYNNIKFDSSWELAYYIWLTDNNIKFNFQCEHIEYIFNNTKHFYIPDFSVNDQLIEIKGDQYFKEDGTMQNPYNHSLDSLFEAKHQCMIKHNVKILKSNDIKPILEYINKKYGKDFLKTFKNYR